MENQPLVPQEILDVLDGKVEPQKAFITGNKRINEEMQNRN